MKDSDFRNRLEALEKRVKGHDKELINLKIKKTKKTKKTSAKKPK